MIIENEDDCFSIDANHYTISYPKDEMVLKKIYIKKKPIEYFFIGGMWYSKNHFSFENNISLPYPFTSYYTYKILDKNFKDVNMNQFPNYNNILYDMEMSTNLLAARVPSTRPACPVNIIIACLGAFNRVAKRIYLTGTYTDRELRIPRRLINLFAASCELRVGGCQLGASFSILEP